MVDPAGASAPPPAMSSRAQIDEANRLHNRAVWWKLGRYTAAMAVLPVLSFFFFQNHLLVGWKDATMWR
jgi:hypothetical protein